MLNRTMDGSMIVFQEGETTVLTVDEKQTDSAIVMALSGELRSEVANDLYDELVALTTVGANVEVDFSGVTYISSATQHIFLRVQQKMDSMKRGNLLLRNIPDPIYREFEKTGTAGLLMIEE